MDQGSFSDLIIKPKYIILLRYLFPTRWWMSFDETDLRRKAGGGNYDMSQSQEKLGIFNKSEVRAGL